MTDQFEKDKNDKQKEIEDFFDKFDKISNDFDRNLNSGKAVYTDGDTDGKTDSEQEAEGRSLMPKTYKTRMERLSESKPQNFISAYQDKLNTNRRNDGEAGAAVADGANSMRETKKKKRHKYTINKKQFFKFLLGIFGACALILGAMLVFIIATTEPIEPGNIYSRLAENSILYDDQGEIVDSLMTSDGLRTNVSYKDLPENLVNAFVAIEDKTFWHHHGFNVVRILGAIKESVVSGEDISGTSTITQQLARNLYLAETKSDRTLTRKIKEAYYAVQLEKHLSKEQIVEAYLNTIFLGYGTNGVQAASQAYFSKDVKDLNLAECAALASLPKAPDRFALLKRYETSQVMADNPNIIQKGSTYTIVYNDAFENRKNLVLSFMLQQKKITKDQYNEAMGFEIRSALNPSEDTTNEISSYFADYTIECVIKDLMEELHISEADANQMIYNNGLRIYTTMNTNMQKIVEKEFTSNSNFPSVSSLKKDGAGNIIGKNGKVLLYSYDNYFDSDGNFTLTPNEYKAGKDGDVVVFGGKRLNFFKTEVQGKTDISVEFKPMYMKEDGVFYAINRGYIHIPPQYKSKDNDGNLVISGQFFKDYPDFFQFNDGMIVGSGNYALEQKVVQPQSAMVIFDYKTGGIKAMVGGRNTEGRFLHNRATHPRQPGSSIKPMGVYGPALQSGLDKANSGITNSASEGNSYGNLWTAASVIDDAPLTIQGKLWPKNWYNGYRGLQTMRQSIEQSINVNAVKIWTDIGVQNSLQFLKKCGISTIVESGDVNDLNAAALALGGMSKGISPLEMAAGYGCFANQGYYTEPIVYTKVTNKQGEVLLEKTASKKQVMDKGVAFIMTDLLRTTVTNGIAGAAAIGNQPVAGKTGTTSDNYDAWFVGFTPQYAASVWIGNDVNIELSQGSVSAAKVWSKIMRQVHAGLPTGSFPSAPSNVISLAIDTKSGRLPSSLSTLGGSVRNEYFIKGTEPTSTDNVHVSATVCADSGYLATPYCPNQVSKVFVKRPYTASSSVGDYGNEQPSYYCNLHNMDTSTYPIDPNKTLNPDFVWDGTSNGGGDPGNGNDNGSGNNGNGNDNGNGNGKDKDKDKNKEEEPPAWLNIFN